MLWPVCLKVVQELSYFVVHKKPSPHLSTTLFNLVCFDQLVRVKQNVPGQIIMVKQVNNYVYSTEVRYL